MRAKRRLTGLIATMFSVGALLASPVVATLDGYHDIGIRTAAHSAIVALSTAPHASLDGYHDI